MKLIRRIVLGVILLVIIGVVVLFMSLDRVIKGTIESQGTEQLKLQTTLSSAALSLLGGKVSLKELEIGSPPGFAAPKMFTLGGIDVGVSYGQLRGNPVHIGNIMIDKPMLVIERGPDNEFNFKKATDNMPKSNSSSSSSSTKLIIDELTLKDCSVVIRPGMPGLPAEIPVNVPTFTMKNVGNGDGAGNGAAMKDVVMQVITAIAGQATNGGGLSGELQTLLNGNLASTLNQLGGDAQKQVMAALPGDLGKNLSGVLADPSKALDPSKLLGSLGSGGPTSRPSLPQLPSVDPGKTLQGIFGGGKK